MPDPLSNLEIQDVLSSIRRLVSEDRKTKEIRQVDSAAEKEAVGKLLLTDAHRIEIVADLDDGDASPSKEVEEIAIAADPAETGEAAQDADWDAAQAKGATAPGAPASVRPASVLEDDIASLETTIAELEAAVAGIGHEFEPDGSEVKKTRDDPDKQALDDAFDDGFAVDIGGPLRFEIEDASLMAPVAGDAMTASGRGKAPGEPDAAEPTEADPEPAPEAAEPTSGADEIAFKRHEPAARRPDWQVISGGDRLLATAGAVLAGRLHLGAANRAADPLDETADEDAAALDATGGAAAATTEAEGAPGFGDGAAVQREEVGELNPAEADVADSDAEAAQADADEEGVAESARTEPAEEFLAEMTEVTEAAADDAPSGPAPTTLAEPLAAAAALSGASADPLDEDGQDDVGLFAPDDETVIDMDMLRDLISEVIREELQGPLGERITRNVRKLVRQEIARVLEAQKFD